MTGILTSRARQPLKGKGAGRSIEMNSSTDLHSAPRLLDQLREALRSRRYSRRTEQTFCHWIKRYIYFHHIRHPAEISLTVLCPVIASTVTRALNGPVCLRRCATTASFLTLPYHSDTTLSIGLKKREYYNPSRCPRCGQKV